MPTELPTNAAEVSFQTPSNLLQWQYAEKKFPSAWQVQEDPDTKKEKNEEYIVEFRVTIVDPEYRKLLNDPDGLQHDDIKQELTAKVTF